MSKTNTKNIIAIALSFILALFAGDKIQAINIANKVVEVVVDSAIPNADNTSDDISTEADK